MTTADEPDLQGPAEPQSPSLESTRTTMISITELESLKKELAEFKDKYQRALAESENARKRMQKERQELIQYALQNIVTEFLDPIDHLENALKFSQQASDEVKNWAVGFQMIAGQFKEVLSNNNVFSFPSQGTAFDPAKHEAVEAVETTASKPGTVLEESLRGYRMGDKIIRPAKVKVAKALSSATEINQGRDEPSQESNEN